jgi:telomerase reverse transcriptase
VAAQLLLRLIDDFLLITTSRSTAERFLRSMHAGHPEYGCFISLEKTRVNFDISLDGIGPVPKTPIKHGFAWCGLSIDQKTLNVRYDYSRLHATYLGNSLTVKTYKRAGETFVAHMLQCGVYCS